MTTITRDWYLELATVPMATPAWEIPDLSRMLDDPALRGTDVLIPGVDGVIANPRRPTVTVYTFPLDVMGDVDEDGTPTADGLAGVVEHLDYLRDTFEAAKAADGTIEAVFHRGATLPALTADAHFLGFQGSSKLGEFLVRTTFDLSVPAGRWTEEGS